MSNVTDTSRAAFHAPGAAARRSTQKAAVARFAVQETKAAKWIWIGKIAQHAHDLGHPALSQTGTAARCLNDLKKDPFKVNGLEYELKLINVKKPPGGDRKVQMWAAVLVNNQK